MNADEFNTAEDALPVPVGDEPQLLDDARLAKIKALLAAATPGPWSANKRIGVVTDHAGQPLAVFGGGTQDHADAAFTAAAPTIVADLLAAMAWHRLWKQVGWRKANHYQDLWERDDLRLTWERGLVDRLRGELSRQGRRRKKAEARVAEQLRAQRNRIDELEDELVVERLPYRERAEQETSPARRAAWLLLASTADDPSTEADAS